MGKRKRPSERLISHTDPEYGACHLIAMQWTRSFTGLIDHLKSKGYVLTRPTRKRLLGAFEKHRVKRRKHVLQKYGKKSSDEIAEALKRADSYKT